jgi:CBS domain-containing protein
VIASDLMTTPVVTTSADASVRDVARLLHEKGIGAVPVLDPAGVPIGMVSDGDLLGRRPEEHRWDWWLEMLADAAPPRDFDDRSVARPVRDVMTAPLIAVEPDTPAPEIASLLRSHRIKRVPVIHNGQILGIVSRTDLLKVIEQFHPAAPAKGDAGEGIVRFLESLAGGAHLVNSGPASSTARAPETASPAAPRPPSAEAFRDEVRAHAQEAIDTAASEKEAAKQERQREAKAIAEQHLSEEAWRQLLERAELAAKQGEKEFPLDRFPSELCSDGGRMIDVAEKGWETTLQGKPAELVERWRSELKPKGFGLVARIVSYVDGVLGDVGLFLTWGG